VPVRHPRRFIGLGYLASSAASYRLAKTLGVLDEGDAGRANNA
jgi:hypothetical protein